MDAVTDTLRQLDERSQEIFRLVVEGYLRDGAPVGSRTVARAMDPSASASTVRNVMGDLEETGLLYAPHVSAGRLPTERGLRLFIDGFLELGEVSESERGRIEALCAGAGRSLREVLREVSEGLSGLASCASLVFAPVAERRPIKHIEFVRLDPVKALVVIVDARDFVENRLIDLPPGLPAHALAEASNYLNRRFSGRPLEEAMEAVESEIARDRADLDAEAEKVVKAGLAVRPGAGADAPLILTGRARLLGGTEGTADMERIQRLFEDLERGRNTRRILDSTLAGPGVHVFIGADSELFERSGCAMIVAPLARGGGREVAAPLGAIGVIGPTRLNYARIIPMVDYTARAVGRLLA